MEFCGLDVTLTTVEMKCGTIMNGITYHIYRTYYENNKLSNMSVISTFLYCYKTLELGEKVKISII